MTDFRIRLRCSSLCRRVTPFLLAGCAALFAAGCNQDEGDVGTGGAPADVEEAPPAPPEAPETPADSGAGDEHASVTKEKPPQAGEAPQPPAGKGAGSERGSDARPPAAKTSDNGKLPPPADLHPPEVILSEHHRNTCLVGVGDAIPPLTLSTLDGKPQELSQLYGERMTIVVFWSTGNFYAREQFTRLMPELEQRYQGLGVNVVAINVGNSPDEVRELVEQHGVAADMVLDPDGEAFQQVAADLLPRTYLLDAEGRILWFDLEYSRSQRIGLHNAVHYHLKQGGV